MKTTETSTKPIDQTENGLRRGLRRLNEPLFECSYCSKKYKLKISLSCHEIAHALHLHNIKDVFKLENGTLKVVKKKVTKKKATMKKVVKNKTATKKPTLKKPTKKNKSKMDIKIKNEKLFECDICNRKYVREINLSKHETTHCHDENFWMCSKCPAIFEYEEDVENHERIHQWIINVAYFSFDCSEENLIFKRADDDNEESYDEESTYGESDAEVSEQNGSIDSKSEYNESAYHSSSVVESQKSDKNESIEENNNRITWEIDNTHNDYVRMDGTNESMNEIANQSIQSDLKQSSELNERFEIEITRNVLLNESHSTRSISKIYQSEQMENSLNEISNVNIPMESSTSTPINTITPIPIEHIEDTPMTSDEQPNEFKRVLRKRKVPPRCEFCNVNIPIMEYYRVHMDLFH